MKKLPDDLTHKIEFLRNRIRIGPDFIVKGFHLEEALVELVKLRHERDVAEGNVAGYEVDE